jgi:hypothetical protein
MTRPLPPIVHGPITPPTPAVLVTSVAPNAAVDVLADGDGVASLHSITGGTLWMPISHPFVDGQKVTAVQNTPGGTSDESAQPVIVTAVPNPLPAPVFVSPLSTCMSTLELTGLQPGATVRVRQGGTVVGTTVAGQPTDSVPMSGSLSAGDRLQATQEIVVGGTTVASPPVLSLPIEGTNREKPLPPPGVGQPVTACRTALDFSGMTPSADVTVDNEGTSSSWLSIASAYTAWGAPLQQGKLVARQRFPRCNMESTKTEVPVGPPKAPGQPVIQARPCPKLRKVHLTGLEPPSVLVLSTVVPHPSTPGTVIVTPIGEATASSTSEDFDLPLGIEPVTNTGAAVQLTARQTLCGLPSSDSSRVGFATPPGPDYLVQIVPPIFECSRRVPVRLASTAPQDPSSQLQPFYADTDEPIGDAVLATGNAMALNLWSPLADHRKVLVRQVGCDKQNADSPVVAVTDLPNVLPVPQIAGPVRPKAAWVGVSGCLPGARVHLLVNDLVRKSIDTFDANPTIPTADLDLHEEDELWAMQTLCTKESSIEGTPTIVKKGNMEVVVQPHTVRRGTSANVAVSATDSDTHLNVEGAQIFLNGAMVGQTGVRFPFSPALGQANPAGVVKKPVAYHDATFSITLTDEPQPQKNRLFLNVVPTTLIPDTLRLVSATWTVTTVWTPVQTFTTGTPITSVTLPNPPPLPADRRVSVVLDTTWEVAGTINGIPFEYQQFPGLMSPNPTLLAWAGNDLTAGWLARHELHEDAAGNPWLIVETRFQSAF